MPKSPTLAIVNGDVVLPNRVVPGAGVLCTGNRILRVGRIKRSAIPRGATVIDAKRGYITPGFVELHVHGGDGADYMDGEAEAVRVANRAHARHGTTTIHPTTTTGSQAQLRAMLDACIEARDSWKIADGARVAGVHWYGPYFAADKIGAHPKHGRRDPLQKEYKRDFDLGIIRVATCAAELPGAVAFYKEASRRGYLVTCGHSNSTWTQMQAAFDNGMRHVDHFWCAMSTVDSLRAKLGPPMQAGMSEFVLATQGMSTEIIADGLHCAPDLLAYTFRMIGPDRLCLVTDSNRALDMPKGRYRIGHKRDGQEFINNGKAGYMPSGGGLASSVSGMDHMVRIMKRDTTATVAEVIRMASLTPARRAGIARSAGSLEAGKRADVLVLDRSLNVRRVFIGGEEYRDSKGPKAR